AVKIVRTGLSHAIDGSAGVHTVLGHQCACFDFEFLHGVRKGKRQVQAVIWIVVHCTIEQILDAVDLASGDRNRCSTLHGAAGCNAGLHRDARQGDEIRDLPSVEGQFEHARVFDHAPHAGGSRFDLGSVGLNLDLLADLSNLQYGVDHGV